MSIELPLDRKERELRKDKFCEMLKQITPDPLGLVGRKFLFYQYENITGGVTVSSVYEGTIIGVRLNLANWGISVEVSIANMGTLNWHGQAWSTDLIDDKKRVYGELEIL